MRLHPLLLLLGHTGNAVSHLCSPSSRETLGNWRGPNRGPPKHLGGWRTLRMKKERPKELDFFQPREEKAEGNLVTLFKCFNDSLYRRCKYRDAQDKGKQAQVTREIPSGCKKKILYCENESTLEWVSQGGGGVTLAGNIQNCLTLSWVTWPVSTESGTIHFPILIRVQDMWMSVSGTYLLSIQPTRWSMTDLENTKKSSGNDFYLQNIYITK